MPHRGAAPQAANQKATLLEWEVYSPTPVNPAFYKLGLQPLTRFELWNNLHRAMTPLAHWYAIIDSHIIELQNEVIHEVLHNRYCLIKWAPMYEQVTLLRKLLSHIFEYYAEVQDDGYISDEDIEQY